MPPLGITTDFCGKNRYRLTDGYALTVTTIVFFYFVCNFSYLCLIPPLTVQSNIQDVKSGCHVWPETIRDRQQWMTELLEKNVVVVVYVPRTVVCSRSYYLTPPATAALNDEIDPDLLACCCCSHPLLNH